jgi:HNH endonuclease
MTAPRNLTKVEGAALKKVLSYDPNTGLFVWLVTSNGRVPKGTVAGTLHHGYSVISYNKRDYMAHRLAWFFVHSYWPENEIDHVNGDKADNRITNLREATIVQSRTHRPTPRSNTSGIKGVYWHKQRSAWIAQINKTHLGVFKLKEEAIKIRKQAEEQYHGEFTWNNQITEHKE